MTHVPLDPHASGPTVEIAGGLSLQLLALELDDHGETYVVRYHPAAGAAAQAGTLRHVEGVSWELRAAGSVHGTTVSWLLPDAAFSVARGRPVEAARVSQELPHWPSSRTEGLARRGLAGVGTLAFDAGWFLDRLATSPVDRPMALPDAASKLGLAGLQEAQALLERAMLGVQTSGGGLVDVLMGALEAEAVGPGSPAWGGDGRLIGEHAHGELAQLGDDLGEGCEAVLGTGPLKVVFEPGEPMGLGLGPLVPGEVVAARGGPRRSRSVGMGVEVGEVDPGSAAERAGVAVGMVLSKLSDPELQLSVGAEPCLSFEAVMGAIDERLASGRPLVVTFDTAAPVTHLYAVEMDGPAALGALAQAQGRRWGQPRDIGAAFAARLGNDLLWRERPSRLFVGQPGSVTCAHTDICPQLQLAHGLLGTKVLGVASHGATPRLSAAHEGAVDPDDEASIDEGATHVPTDRPLSPRETELLCDGEVTLVLLGQGDLAVFDSGALHFASNGAHAHAGALYHGMITTGAVPRLRLAAAAHRGTPRGADSAYRDHLVAPELLRRVLARLQELGTAATGRGGHPPRRT